MADPLDLVTFAALREYGRTLVGRLPDLLAVPKRYTATVISGGAGDVTVADDSPPRPDGRAPDPIYARVVSGYAHPNERVVVHHEPPAGNSVVGTASGGGGFIDAGSPGGWTNILGSDNGSAFFAPSEFSRWRRYGQLLVAAATVRFGTSGFNGGTTGTLYQVNLPFPAVPTASGGDAATVLGRGMLSAGASINKFAECWVLPNTDGTIGTLQMVPAPGGAFVAVGQGTTGFPFFWGSGASVQLALSYEVAPGS